MLEDVNRRAKIYSLTARGRSALKSEAESWRRYARAMELVLATTNA
jgi:DNA-binding PadR family transcriptional regulator